MNRTACGKFKYLPGNIVAERKTWLALRYHPCASASETGCFFSFSERVARSSLYNLSQWNRRSTKVTYHVRLNIFRNENSEMLPKTWLWSMALPNKKSAIGYFCIYSCIAIENSGSGLCLEISSLLCRGGIHIEALSYVSAPPHFYVMKACMSRTCLTSTSPHSFNRAIMRVEALSYAIPSHSS
jgi:hypothetical protein